VNNNEHIKTEDATAQTAHLALLQPHKPTQKAKPKEPFLANALIKITT